MDGLPEEALAKLYVNGEAATKAAERRQRSDQREEPRSRHSQPRSGPSRAASASTARSRRSSRTAFANLEAYESKLLEAAPEDALAFISGNGYGQVEKSLRDTPGTFDQLRDFLGIDVEGLTGLFEGEFAFWVGRGAPIPELTFLAEVEDEAQRARGPRPPRRADRPGRATEPPRSTVSRRSRSCSTGSRSPTRRSTARSSSRAGPERSPTSVRRRRQPGRRPGLQGGGRGRKAWATTTFGFLYLDLAAARQPVRGLRRSGR